MLLAGNLGRSWFAVLEALQNEDYVLTTHGISPPGSVPLGPNTVRLLVCQASVAVH